MKVVFALAATSSLLFACSSNRGGGGSSPTPPGVPDPVAGAPTPDEVPDDGPAEQEPAEKPLEPLVTASLDELVTLVAPQFAPEATTDDQVSDQLEAVEQAFSAEGLDYLQQPREVAQSEESDPDLESGGTCKGLYHGFITLDFDWWTLDASHVRDVVRYGVKPTDTEDLKREVIGEHPAYATISYRETRDGSFFDTVNVETVHIGRKDDQLLMVTEVTRTSKNLEFPSDASVERCARLLDFKGHVVKKACSEARYGSEHQPHRTDRTTSEVLVDGSYSKSDRETTQDSGKTLAWNTELKQTGPDTESFVHDFRSYITASEGGLFGGLFPPYAYAAGDLKFTKDATDASRATDCGVTTVRFDP